MLTKKTAIGLALLLPVSLFISNLVLAGSGQKKFPQGAPKVDLISPLEGQFFKGHVLEGFELSNPIYDIFYQPWTVSPMGNDRIEVVFEGKDYEGVDLFYRAECTINFVETLWYSDLKRESYRYAPLLKGFVHVFDLRPTSGSELFINPYKESSIQPCQTLYVHGLGEQRYWALNLELADHETWQEPGYWPSAYLLLENVKNEENTGADIGLVSAIERLDAWYSANGAYKLSVMLRSGIDVNKDSKLSHEWLFRAAFKGSARARADIAELVGVNGQANIKYKWPLVKD